MRQKLEERFCYLEQVSALEQFLFEKKRRLIREKERKGYSEEKVRKLRKYLNLLEQVLESGYFSNDFKYWKVYQLVERLKQDDVSFREEREKLQQKIAEMKRYLLSAEEFSMDESHVIEDEKEDWEKALARKRGEYEREIASVQEEMWEFEKKLTICRNLKGMICRPQGFFDTVLR